jgi:hypothetical protein
MLSSWAFIARHFERNTSHSFFEEVFERRLMRKEISRATLYNERMKGCEKLFPVAVEEDCSFSHKVAHCVHLSSEADAVLSELSNALPGCMFSAKPIDNHKGQKMISVIIFQERK